MLAYLPGGPRNRGAVTFINPGMQTHVASLLQSNVLIAIEQRLAILEILELINEW
jgi:hypothetical protein